MPDNILIPLPGFEFPADFPYRMGFVTLVDDQLRRLRSTGHFVPPRFFGYYVQKRNPIGVAGSWTVHLDADKRVHMNLELLSYFTNYEYSIESDEEAHPKFILVHDRQTRSCWLVDYTHGLFFIESYEPFIGGGEVPKLSGPHP